MSLAQTLDIARSSLALVSDRSAVVSRNVAHSGDAGATRKIVRLTTDPGYAPRLTGIVRGIPDALQGRILSASSDAARESVIVNVLDQLQAVGDPQSSESIGAKLSELRMSLQTFAARPGDSGSAAGAVSAAKDVVTTLHTGAAEVERARVQADADIAATVSDLNQQLYRLAELDTVVTNGTRSGLDVTDDLDERDRVIGNIAEQVGLTVIRRADQGVAIYTDSGIPLYDGSVRSVGIENEPVLPGQPGGLLSIDGMQASGAGAVMRITSGRLAGLLEIRDGVGVAFGAQLDEIARNLIAQFAEADQRQPSTLPDVPGLFRRAGSLAVSADVAVQPGLAATIEINPNVDPGAGGDAFRLRDGNIAGVDPGYVYNSEGQSGFSARLLQLTDGMSAEVEIARETELSTRGSLLDVASASAGWLQGMRKSRGERADFAHSLHDRAQSMFNQISGVNIDEQITELLELQRSYQATSKLITTVDAMFNSLLQALR